MKTQNHPQMNFLAIVVFLIPSLTLADFSGVVVGITDGDTISVMHDGKAEKIRPAAGIGSMWR